jgi:uncharacterized membrane protein
MKTSRLKKMTTLLALIFSTAAVSACPLCNKQIRDGIANSAFFPNLLTMMSAFIVLAIIVAFLSALATRRHKSRLALNPNIQLLTPVPLTTAAMVMGIGYGGFIDGIFFHQIFQFHEMLSARVPSTDYVGKSINMFWDGIFHLFCLIVALIGTVLLWKLTGRNDINRSGRLLSGGLLMGWGIFNIVEGVIDHHLLELHNVIELSDNHAPGNFAFLGASVLMILVGSALARSGRKQKVVVINR